jgi:O-acetylserine/cysteine efflux transporter
VVPRHPAATVTTLALLIPVFGMGALALSLGEFLPG